MSEAIARLWQVSERETGETIEISSAGESAAAA
jgi:hypothetical protein